MTPLHAHLLCVALVVADVAARAWRIQWIVQGLGHRITFWDSVVLNAFGDAACALTPLRIGGEPARLAGMLRSRVPATASFVAISLEVLAAWPVILVAAAWVGWKYAPAWWDLAGPRLVAAAEAAWPWVLLVGVASIVAWRAARRVTSPMKHLGRPIRRALVYWRRMPRWPLIASVPMSFVNLAARVAILPVLALTLPNPPALGPLTVGSFTLLYSQLVLPTPSGLGAVELGFLGGAVGDLGPEDGQLLFAWRMYTNGIGVILGVALAAQIYGWAALRQLAGRWSDPH